MSSKGVDIKQVEVKGVRIIETTLEAQESADIAVPFNYFYTPVVIVSPGEDEGEFKHQDRALAPTSNCPGKQIAIVCDGVSQSPNSAEAAEYVTENAQRLYMENGVQEIVEELVNKREKLMNTPINLDHMESDALRSIFEDIVREKRTQSHQTTFASICIEKDEAVFPDQLCVKIRNCGDSGLFIFTQDGRLVHNNLNLEDENTPLNHASFVTHALPDSYIACPANVTSDEQKIPYGAEILLCTDGLYDCFNNFREIFVWLNENRSALVNQDTKEIMCNLHSVLSKKSGDDDISLIWLFPAEDSIRVEAEEVEEEIEQEVMRPAPKRGFAKLWYSALRFFRSANSFSLSF